MGQRGWERAAIVSVLFILCGVRWQPAAYAQAPSRPSPSPTRPRAAAPAATSTPIPTSTLTASTPTASATPPTSTPTATPTPTSTHSARLVRFPTRQRAAQRQTASAATGAARQANAALQRDPTAAAKVTYHGGNVMTTVTTYAIFWSPNNALNGSFQSLINRYFTDVGGSSYYAINTQYFQNPGPTFIQNSSTFGGAAVDTTSYSGRGSAANPLLDSDIETAVQRAIAAHPSWNPPGLTTAYFVFTEPGIESCSDSTRTSCTPGITSISNADPYCAYHSYVPLGNANAIYATLPFTESWPSACRAFNTSPNGNMAADSVIATLAHEHFEVVTDPLPDIAPGWFDSTPDGEIADKCVFRYGNILSDGSNVSLNGNAYIVQQEWSNAQSDGVTPFGGCALSFGQTAGSPTPTGVVTTATVTLTPGGTPGLTDTPQPSATPTLTASLTPVPTAVTAPTAVPLTVITDPTAVILAVTPLVPTAIPYLVPPVNYLPPASYPPPGGYPPPPPPAALAGPLPPPPAFPPPAPPPAGVLPRPPVLPAALAPAAANNVAGIPLIPEADTLPLVVTGLAAAAAVGALRGRRR